MTHQVTRSPRRNGPQILSTLLFVAAIGFAAAAVYIWYMDDANEDDAPPVPSVEAGRYELVNVLNALEDAGLEADYGRSPATARTDQIDRPGQNLRVEETNVFIFVFNGANAEEAATARDAVFVGIDPATMSLTTPSGNDVSNGEPLSVYQGANVIAVLIGGDEDVQAEVRDVIEGLS
ncbi:MAG: hypothetical protein M3490_05205 [Chloroflexota bacterium]|nr:hypothetical protein [Chloroflexota bacterium]